VKDKRPALFRGRHFQDEIIVLCLGRYMRYSPSYQDLEEMAERGTQPGSFHDRSLVLPYAPILISGFAVRCASPTAPGG
jgi:hypothetical protein